MAYKTYVRPLVEYASEIWNPSLKYQIARIEKIQKYFTRVSLRKCMTKYVSYEERLTMFGIHSLEFRRKITDLTMVYKIMTNQTNIVAHDFFPMSLRNNVSRQHPFQIRTKNKSKKTENSFLNRITNDWNRLNHNTVTALTVKTFKRRLIDNLLKSEAS